MHPPDTRQNIETTPTLTMRSPPFPLDDQIEPGLDWTGSTSQLRSERLPGQPRIKLTDHAKIRSHIEQEFRLGDLEELSPRLWMLSKQDSKNISPLHRQIVKGRNIICAEDPRLHLVWYYDRIFIKPLPRFLTAYDFWQLHICSKSAPDETKRTINRAILGYLRTYAHLIKYESDFRIALDLGLVPSGVSFTAFCDFIAHFEGIPDSDVALRYSFGELRLSRLNLYSKLFLQKLAFHRVHAQYGDYFGAFYNPLLFAFGIFSVILNALQVGLTAQPDSAMLNIGAWWLSIMVLVMVIAVSLLLDTLFWFKFVKEWAYAIKDRYSKMR